MHPVHVTNFFSYILPYLADVIIDLSENGIIMPDDNQILELPSEIGFLTKMKELYAGKYRIFFNH